MTDTERNSLPEDGNVAGGAPARIDERLDCSGLRCPLPLLRTKQMLHRLPSGAVLEVMATDAGAERDIPAFVTLSAHRLLGRQLAGGIYLFWIEKGAN